MAVSVDEARGDDLVGAVHHAGVRRDIGRQRRVVDGRDPAHLDEDRAVADYLQLLGVLVKGDDGAAAEQRRAWRVGYEVGEGEHPRGQVEQLHRVRRLWFKVLMSCEP